MTEGNDRIPGWVLNGLTPEALKNGLVRLENPIALEELENRCKSIWPGIINLLIGTGMFFSPTEEMEFDSATSFVPCRSFQWFLFRNQLIIYKGKFTTTPDSWMVNHEFTLQINPQTDLNRISALLKETEFSSNPPLLQYQRAFGKPSYFIEFHSGRGTDWRRYSGETALAEISSGLECAVRLNKFSGAQIWSDKKIGEFIRLARPLFGES